MMDYVLHNYYNLYDLGRQIILNVNNSPIYIPKRKKIKGWQKKK